MPLKPGGRKGTNGAQRGRLKLTVRRLRTMRLSLLVDSAVLLPASKPNRRARREIDEAVAWIDQELAAREATKGRCYRGR